LDTGNVSASVFPSLCSRGVDVEEDQVLSGVLYQLSSYFSFGVPQSSLASSLCVDGFLRFAFRLLLPITEADYYRSMFQLVLFSRFIFLFPETCVYAWHHFGRKQSSLPLKGWISSFSHMVIKPPCVIPPDKPVLICHSHPLSQSIFVFFLLFLSADVHQFCELDIDMRAVVSLGKGSDYTLSFLELDKSLVTCGSVHHFFAAILQFLKNASIKDEYGHQLYYGLSGLFWLSQTFRDAGVSLVRAAESIEWLRQRGRLIVRDMFDGKKLVDSGFM
jgi:hypothetical protein